MKKLLTIMIAFILALALSVSAFTASFAIDFGGGFTLIVESDTRADLAKRAFEITNKIRADNDLDPMIWDDCLARPAMQRAVEASISDDDFNSRHKRPDGQPWNTAALGAKAENLVYGELAAAQSAVDELMSIDEYSSNILNPNFTSLAVGCVEISPDEFYWIQLFGDEVNPDAPDYYIITFEDGCGSGISNQMIPDGGKITKPVDPIKAGYIVGGWFRDQDFSEQWDFDTDSVDSDITLYLKWIFIGYDNSDGGNADDGDVDDFYGNSGNSGNNYSPGSSSGGSGSSGGGSGGGSFSGNVSPAPVNTPQAVTASDAIKMAIAALNAAKASDAKTASVKFTNPGMISLEALQAMSNEAGTTALTVRADSTGQDGKSVDVRLSFYPANATKSIDLSASTTSGNADRTKKLFEKWFNNTVSVISCTQQGDFGMNMEIAARLDSKLNKDTLIFYSYDPAANSYRQIAPTPQYRIDQNGYVHFTTTFAGDIVICDKPLRS